MGIQYLDFVQLRQIFVIDLLHHLPHGLRTAGIFTGKENTVAGANEQANQTYHHNHQDGHPAACGNGSSQRLCACNDPLHCTHCRSDRFSGGLNGSSFCPCRFRSLHSSLGGRHRLRGGFPFACALIGYFDFASCGFDGGRSGTFLNADIDRFLSDKLPGIGRLSTPRLGCSCRRHPLIIARDIDGTGCCPGLRLSRRLHPLPHQLLPCPDCIMGHIFNAAGQLIGGIFLFGLPPFLQTDIGVLHPFTGHGSLIYGLNGIFGHLPEFDVRHDSPPALRQPPFCRWSDCTRRWTG